MSEAGKKVLVMDDEEIVAEIAQQMLKHLGYETAVAARGEDAIRLYREAYEQEDPFDLVIMDLNIPQGMGGMEAVRHVLKIDSEAKVMVSSGYSSDPIMHEYGDYGFTGCIAKPFDLKGLEEAVQAAMHQEG